MVEHIDTEEMRTRIASVKKKISELASDSSKSDLKEFYVMGLITPLLDDLVADPAIIVG